MMTTYKLTVFLLFVVAVLCSCNNSTKKTDNTVITENSAFQSINTNVRIVPTMQSNLADGNVVHSANVEYLWNAIITNSDKTISVPPLVKEFAESDSWENTMDNNNLVLAFGEPAKTYESVIRQYREKYNINKTDLSPQGSSFWGYTDKIVNYKYAKPFEEQPFSFLGTEVAAFGFNSAFASSYTKEYFKNQFKILYYDTAGQFVVQLIPANSNDDIILVMLNKQTNFLEMFNTSKQMISIGKDKTKQLPTIFNLNSEDELIVPVIQFKAHRNYSELTGLQFSSTYGPIESFEQSINFNFDRKGVVLESQISIADSVGIPQRPKLLRFDRPFYLYIKESKSAFPYFNLWVSDAAILEEKKQN